MRTSVTSTLDAYFAFRQSFRLMAALWY
jgi:hypothetical protein